jgi:starch phosphorylase
VTGYKRNNLVFADPQALIDIANKGGPIQIVVSGKTHPRDDIGKGMVRHILETAERFRQSGGRIRMVYLQNYDMEIAKALVSGCDLWLNNARRPLEACGTSGMKAAMNGVPNISVYDGWWAEGGLEGVNGWGIGKRVPLSDISETSDPEDQREIYNKLSQTILPTFYGNRERWLGMAKASIATVGPLFNSYRMVQDYLVRVYSEPWA